MFYSLYVYATPPPLLLKCSLPARQSSLMPFYFQFLFPSRSSGSPHLFYFIIYLIASYSSTPVPLQFLLPFLTCLFQYCISTQPLFTSPFQFQRHSSHSSYLPFQIFLHANQDSISLFLPCFKFLPSPGYSKHIYHIICKSPTLYHFQILIKKIAKLHQNIKKKNLN